MVQQDVVQVCIECVLAQQQGLCVCLCVYVTSSESHPGHEGAGCERVLQSGKVIGKEV